MGILTIDKLAAGMVLKSRVVDRSGRLLLETGTELLTKHLRMLRTWGVAEVDINTLDAPADSVMPAVEDISQERLAAAERELLPLFSNTDLSSPVMGELFKICILRRVRHESCQAHS